MCLTTLRLIGIQGAKSNKSRVLAIPGNRRWNKNRYAVKRKQTREELFLIEMDQVVPWNGLVTATNVADITQVDKLLHVQGSVVCADAGYTGVEKRPEHQAVRLRC